MSSEVKVSKLPRCDIHYYLLGEDNVTAEYDGKTKSGPWANMCGECFAIEGIGLGTGRGQRLVLAE